MAVVLFGSETGCAEDTAGRISRALIRCGVAVDLLASLDSARVNAHWLSPDYQFANHIHIFVVSTTGDGDPPRNMALFWRSLFTPTTPRLPFLKFAVFGLGDSSYRKFNFIAKILHNRLISLGANAIVQKGLGDDRDGRGLDEALSPFVVELCRACSPPSTDPNTVVKAMQTQLPLLPPRVAVWRVQSDCVDDIVTRTQGCVWGTASDSVSKVGLGSDDGSTSEMLCAKSAAVRAAAATAQRVELAQSVLRGGAVWGDVGEVDGRVEAAAAGEGGQWVGVVTTNVEVTHAAAESPVRHLELALTRCSGGVGAGRGHDGERGGVQSGTKGVQGGTLRHTAPWSAGDAVGVRPVNPAAAADELLSKIDADGDAIVFVAVGQCALPRWAAGRLVEMRLEQFTAGAAADTGAGGGGAAGGAQDECATSNTTSGARQHTSGSAAELSPPACYTASSVQLYLLQHRLGFVCTLRWLFERVVDVAAPPRTLLLETYASVCGGDDGTTVSAGGSAAAVGDSISGGGVDVGPTSADGVGAVDGVGAAEEPSAPPGFNVDDEREKLLEMATAKGAPLLHEYSTRERRTPAEVLRDFPTVGMSLRGDGTVCSASRGVDGDRVRLAAVPLGRLLEALPLMRERLYSIATAPWEGGSDAVRDAADTVRTAADTVGDAATTAVVAGAPPTACERSTTVSAAADAPAESCVWIAKGVGVGATEGLLVPARTVSETSPPNEYTTDAASSSHSPLEPFDGALAVCVGVLRYTTAIYRFARIGLASSFLSDLCVGGAVALTFHSADHFHLPASPDVPCVYVGTGTGVAPLRSLAWSRAVSTQRSLPQVPLSKCRAIFHPPPTLLPHAHSDSSSTHSLSRSNSILIHGFRWNSVDCLYGSEWSGLGVQHILAASREAPPPHHDPQCGKYYVQTALASTAVARSVRACLDAGAHVYVAGSARVMPTAVAEAVGRIIAAPPAAFSSRPGAPAPHTITNNAGEDVSATAALGGGASVCVGTEEDAALLAALAAVDTSTAVAAVDALRKVKRYHEDCWE